MEYFKIGKLSSGKTESTINQYIRVVHQLCDFCHKEINMITTDDVLSFMVKYRIQNNVKVRQWILSENICLLCLVIYISTKR